MSLLLPMANATLTLHFGNAFNLEPRAYHIGVETAMFNYYSGAVVAAHFHLGTDWAAAAGTGVVACEAGTVEYAGWAVPGSAFDGGGNIVVVKIAGGMFYVPCHLSSINVAVGQAVVRGQRLGTQGHTGNATGDHVHLLTYTETSTKAKLFHNPEHFMPGGKYADSALIKPPALPDTSTGGNVDILASYSPPATVSFPAGTYTGYKLGGTTKKVKVSATGAHTSAKAHIDKGVLVTGYNGTFVYIVDGIWAGYWLPITGLTVS